MKVLVVEDEADLRSSMSTYINESGHECVEAENLFSGEDALIDHSFDIVVLDLNLPDGNGLTLLKHLKEEYPNTGVLIVSARNALDDRIEGLDLGADDYITKPFHLAELGSRINALIRRTKFQGSTNVAFNEIILDTDALEVKVNGTTIDATKKEYDIILYFISNKERVITKEALADHLWGDELDHSGSYDFIYTHIRNLRKKIVAAGGKDYVKSVYGVGYKFSEQ